MKLLRKLLLFGLFVFSSLFLQFCNNRCKGGNSTQTRVIDSFTFSDPFYSKTSRVFIARDSIVMNPTDTLHFEMYAATHLVNNVSKSSEGLYACDISISFNLIDFDSMAVFTEVDFDQQHKASSRVDEFFKISGYGANSPMFSVAEYARYRLTSGGAYGNFTLSLIKKPINKLLRIKLFFYRKILGDGIRIQSPTFTFKQ